MDKTKLMVTLLIALALVAAHQGSRLDNPFLAFFKDAPQPVTVPTVVQTTVPVPVTTVPPPSSTRVSGTIAMELAPAYGVVATAAGETWMRIRLCASHLPGDHRAPVHLALVLDRSASMAAKNKLNYAKEAAKLAVSQLGQEDTVAIVAFDSVSAVLLPSTPVRDQAAIDAVIDNIAPGGSTNLSDGLTDGQNEVARQMVKGHVNRVILMTDGLANFGVTDPEALAAMARQMGSQGIPLTTIGLGDEYNETLLVNLAEYSGGHYYYVGTPHDMVRIFQNEVQMLLSVVARDVQLDVEPGAHVQISEIQGSKAATRSPSGWTISLGDFYSGQVRNLYVRLMLEDAGQATTAQLATAHLRYADQTAGARTATAQARVAIGRSSSAAAIEASADTDVLTSVQKVISASRIEEAMTQAESGHVADAQRLLLEQGTAVRAANVRLHSAALDELGQTLQRARESVQTFAPAPDSEGARSAMKQYRYEAYSLSR